MAGRRGADGKLCRLCGHEVISYSGPVKEFALVNLEPTPDEVSMGHTASYAVVRQELAQLGVDVDDVFLGTVWHHPDNGNEHCRDAGLGALLKALAPVKKVLVFGTPCAQIFLNQNSMTVSGLWLTSNLLKGKQVMAAGSPSNLYTGSLGEFRLALSRFFGKSERKAVKWEKDKLNRLWKLSR